MASGAVFLDRDGVISIPEFRDGRSFAPRSFADFNLYPDALPSLARLKAAGWILVVVTNQPDVGHGLVPRAEVEAMHARLAAAAPLTSIEVCYHTQADGCACRKPAPGMLLHAAEKFGINLTASIMVGDRASDVAAGKAAGCRTIFIDLGYTESRPANPDAVAGSLSEACNWILGTATADRACGTRHS